MKPFATPKFIRRDQSRPGFRRPLAASQPYQPGELPKVYGWPNGLDVTPLTIVICELGGKFYPSDIPSFVAKSGLPTPKITTHLLAGSDDSSSDADAEVALDWQRVAESYSYMTGLPANIVLVYGPNTGQAFAQCMDYANSLSNIGAGSWSWGSRAPTWDKSDRETTDTAAKASPYPWCAASGDNDSSDGSPHGKPNVDLPAGSIYFLACGGTSRPPTGPETVWNNGGGEGTGGGFINEALYPLPSWQPKNSQSPKSGGRMVPDWAVVADPDTGYNTLINGQWEVIGGTSAAAPLLAGFLAAVNGARLKKGLPMLSALTAGQTLWGFQSSFLDITSGNNGAYKATIGPDPCSGLGRPLGTLVSDLLSTPIQ